MIDLLIIHAGELLTGRTQPGGAIAEALQKLDIIPDGAVAVEAGRIIETGPTTDLLPRFAQARQVIDARGQLVTPGLIDCHSHLLFAGSRHEEYESLVTGRSGKTVRLDSGIRYTVSRTRQASNEALRSQALADLDTMLAHGTTLLETKTGYGLDKETELRLVKLQRSLSHKVDLVSTYLGAHVVPEEYRSDRSAYVDLVIQTLPEARPFADYCDVTCDPIGFTAEECSRICDAALALGYRIRVHADQMGYAGGAELAARYQAASADHLDYISDAGIAAMAACGTTGVLLPSVTFHMLEMTPSVEGGEWKPPVKPFLPLAVQRMIAGGMRLAISADYNPGSSPSPSMQMAMQAAARLFRLGYAEIWHMSTINAAYALDQAGDRGSLEPGKRADIILWNVPSHGLVINRFGVNHALVVIKDGEVAVQNGAL